MLERFFESEHFRQVVTDFPTGAHDAAQGKRLFKQIILALEMFLRKSNLFVSWESKTIYDVCDFVVYDSEEDRISETPVDVGRCIITVGQDDVFMPHPRAAVLLARKLVDLVANVQSGMVTA